MASGNIPQPNGVQNISITFEDGITDQGSNTSFCKKSDNVYCLSVTMSVTKAASTGWYSVLHIPSSYAPSASVYTVGEHFGVNCGEVQLTNFGYVQIDHAAAETNYIIRFTITWIK